MSPALPRWAARSNQMELGTLTFGAPARLGRHLQERSARRRRHPQGPRPDPPRPRLLHLKGARPRAVLRERPGAGYEDARALGAGVRRPDAPARARKQQPQPQPQPRVQPQRHGPRTRQTDRLPPPCSSSTAVPLRAKAPGRPSSRPWRRAKCARSACPTTVCTTWTSWRRTSRR